MGAKPESDSRNVLSGIIASALRCSSWLFVGPSFGDASSEQLESRFKLIRKHFELTK
jgi:hypothetical protein